MNTHSNPINTPFIPNLTALGQPFINNAHPAQKLFSIDIEKDNK